MSVEVDKKDYSKTMKLFSQLSDDHLSVLISLEHNYPSRIIVNSLDSPSSGFIYLGKRTLGFCGRSDSGDFNKDIKTLLQDELLPLLQTELKVSEIIIRYDIGWKELIPSFFDNLVEHNLGNYVFENLKHDYKKYKLPEDYQYAIIDSELLKRKNLKNFYIVDRWVRGCYLSTEDYLARGFGYCIIHKEEEIASTCMCNYISKDRERCEIGIITDEEHRKRGLAKNLVSRTLTHSIELGIKRVDWQTRMNNIGSIKTAETVGFELKKLYSGYVIENKRRWKEN